MAKKKKIQLTQEDIDLIRNQIPNLQNQIPEVQNLLKQDKSAKTAFFKNPFKFLREKFNISLMGLIADFKSLIRRFNQSAKELFNKLTEQFDGCFACKLSALIIIYATLAKLGGLTVIAIELVDKFVELLQISITNKGTSIDKFIEKLKWVAETIKPSRLAEVFCKELGPCNPDWQLAPA